MAQVLDRLRTDHENLARVLSVLDRQIELIDRCKDIDYDVMRDVIDFFKSRAHTNHLLCEEAILERLKRKTPGVASVACNLLTSHRRTAELLQRMSALIDELLNDVDTERRDMVSALKTFAASVRQNVAQEEERLYLAAEAALSPSDWALAQCLAPAGTPLSDAVALPGFVALREAIERLPADAPVAARAVA